MLFGQGCRLLRIRRRMSNPQEVAEAATFRTVSYIAVDKNGSGRMPQWPFLQDFEPAARYEEKAAQTPMNTGDFTIRQDYRCLADGGRKPSTIQPNR
jgi:hypothetical protein